MSNKFEYIQAMKNFSKKSREIIIAHLHKNFTEIIKTIFTSNAKKLNYTLINKPISKLSSLPPSTTCYSKSLKQTLSNILARKNH